jgi:acetyl-CoA carboxylase carboxyltransferase component
MSERTKHQLQIDELNLKKKKTLELGGLQKIEKQHASGKLTARERIDRLLDKNSFFEIGQLAHSDQLAVKDKTPADGKICGYGTINQKNVAITSDDVTVLAGSGGIVGYSKEFKVHEQARKKGIPAIHLGEGGGARIPDIMGATGMMRFTYDISHPPRDRFIPTITAIMGECYGGPMWKASVSDIVIMVKGAVMAVTSPLMIELANAEKVSKQNLGGWEFHAKTTGLVDIFAENDVQSIEIIKKTLAYLPQNADEFVAKVIFNAPSKFKQNDILSILPEDQRYAYNMHHLLECFIDTDSLWELKPFFDGSLITTFARIEGQTVGILANNPKVNAGAMGPEACQKAVSFITICDSFNIPLIFIHDTPGFFVSKAAEENQMPVRIMNFIAALQHCTVPKISLIVRKSYGMAHCNMLGANMGADVLMAFPGAEISFTSPEIAAQIVLGKSLKEADNPVALKQAFLEEMTLKNAPYEAAGLGLIDRLIDPRKTREELTKALRFATTHQKSKRLMASWNKM